MKTAVNEKYDLTLLLVSRGTSGLDIDLRVVDINQCHANTSSFNIFGGTDKCKTKTTTVRSRAGRSASKGRRFP